MTAQPTPWTDELVREVLRLRQRGLSYDAIGERFGLTRNAISGFMNRAHRASDAIPCECTKAENMDGAGWKW